MFDFMSLLEHIDALDKMIVLGSSVPELRSQVAFIGREVAVLESENSQLHLKLEQTEAVLVKMQQPDQPPSIKIINPNPLPPVEPLL